MKRNSFLWQVVISGKWHKLNRNSEQMRFNFCSQFSDFILFFFSFFLGILQYAAGVSDHLAILRRRGCDPTTVSSRCGCGPCRPSRSVSSGSSLLLVQGLASLKALRAALQPYCDSSLTGGLARCQRSHNKRHCFAFYLKLLILIIMGHSSKRLVDLLEGLTGI